MTPLALALAALFVASGCALGAPRAEYNALSDELEQAAPATPPDQHHESDNPFAGQATLSRDALVRRVLERNPSIEAARQAWRETLAKYPQMTALDDPRASYRVAPMSIGSDMVDPMQEFMLEQMLPFPGKRGLMGEIAVAEAAMKREDFAAVRLSLANMAAMLHADYYATERALDINKEHQELVADLAVSAEAQYVVGHGSQQDPLQAEVELAMLEEQRVMLTARRDTIVARINTLLHTTPNAPLPPAPGKLALPVDDAPMPESLESALPELAMLKAEEKAAESAEKLARREYFPDIGVSGAYSTMQPMEESRYMVGVSVNVPIQLGRRGGALDEARARGQKSRRLLDHMKQEAIGEIETARIGFEEARRVAELYETKIIPAARDRQIAARAGYETGRNDFMATIEAERSLRTLELRRHEAIANAWRMAAELERALGRVPGENTEGALP
ncbi:TolC family protein [bacterium]|nr:TolC family protein [bacterium]